MISALPPVTFVPNNLALMTRVSLKIRRSFGFNKSTKSVNFLSSNDFVFLFNTRRRLASLFSSGAWAIRS